jgi:hypothetical protein
MSMIMTRCPRTWREIAAGIDTDPTSYKNLPDLPSKLQCPACGDEHVWRKSQTWLAHGRLTGAGEPDPGARSHP